MTSNEMPELAQRFKDAVECYGDQYETATARNRYRGDAGELLAQYHTIELHHFTDLANELVDRITALQTALIQLGIAKELYELGGREEFMAYQHALITARIKEMESN